MDSHLGVVKGGHRRLLVAGTLLLAILASAVTTTRAEAGIPSTEVRVMTRNLYLGSDLGPGLDAPNFKELVKGAGEIYRSVGKTNFRVRAVQLAQEIRGANADLVGLQEAALWRERKPPYLYVPIPTSFPANTPPPTSQNVRFDFIKLLVAALNKGVRSAGERYSVIPGTVKDEFDFEVPTDADGKTSTCKTYPRNSNPKYPQAWTKDDCKKYPGADLTARLTMRDAIIAKGLGTNVVASNARTATYGDENGDGDIWDPGDKKLNLFTPLIGGAAKLPVTRGWTAATVRVRGSEEFRFVNTHFEAFGDTDSSQWFDYSSGDNRVGSLDGEARTDCRSVPDPTYSAPTWFPSVPHPISIRCLQARELYQEELSQHGALPVILVGDLNSDDDSVSANEFETADPFAYNSLLTDGMVPLTQVGWQNNVGGGSCCLADDLLAKKAGYAADFDHHIDHIMTKSGSGINRIGNTFLTGTKPFRKRGRAVPRWSSDHAGVWQALSIPNP